VISHLHPALALLGLIAGAIGAVVGWRWPSRRYLALPAAIGAALVVFAATTPVRDLVVAAVATAIVLACLVMPRVAGVAHGGVGPLAWVPALALPVVAAVYLSTPDTEGSVVLAAALVPVAAVARLDQWRGPATTIACWVLSIVAGTAAVAWSDASGQLSLGGWWLAKAALAALEVALVVFALQEFRASAPVRPPP
jgi:hypothetical protein